MTHEVYVTNKIMRFENNALHEVSDHIATEFPLTIYINNEEFATIVCTPEYMEELIIGFLASEGIIRKFSDIENFHLDDSKGLCHITLSHAIHSIHANHSKRLISSCCGKSRQFYFVNDMQTSKVSTTDKTITPEEVIRMKQHLQNESKAFQVTGGLHNAAISDGGNFYIHRTDIGRHNAMDKLYGYCILNRIPIKDKILIFSGRISSEILIKASKIGVGIILSKSAPTDLAIKLADDLNITAIGFIRDDSFNVYSHPKRLIT